MLLWLQLVTCNSDMVTSFNPVVILLEVFQVVHLCVAWVCFQFKSLAAISINELESWALVHTRQ